jgi:hypothetical protein
MSQSQADKRRRQVLKLALSGVVAVPLSNLLVHGRARAAELVPVSELRQCAIFPGKGVNENGWCSAWVLKS